MIYKLVTRIIEHFCFPERPMKGGDILDFSKGGNLRKGGVDLENRGMTPLTNYDCWKHVSWDHEKNVSLNQTFFS